jgi:hypothetical protein
MRTQIFEAVSWNIDSYQEQIKQGLTEKQFVERGLSEGKYDSFDSDTRKKLLIEAYRMIKNFH